jgi:hypothetical protein
MSAVRRLPGEVGVVPPAGLRHDLPTYLTFDSSDDDNDTDDDDDSDDDDDVDDGNPSTFFEKMAARAIRQMR